MMSPYQQGRFHALIKLGLSDSANSAIGGSAVPAPTGSSSAGIKTPNIPGIKPIKSVKPPKLFDAGKMQDAAWGHAQKDLDTAESRAIGKVDSWQQSSPLPTGSST
jgi:hypothetical protein